MHKMLIDELTKLLGEDACLSDPADQYLYGYDHSCMSSKADVVTLPSTTAEVQAIIKIANKYKVPVIARGQATNTCGATVPTSGGIIIATQRLNKIIKINRDDRYAVVQPGVINQQLQTELQQYKLFWPPDPGSANICTIGGNLACNAAGPSAVKYGVTRDHVLGLTFITGNGDLIKTGVYTTKGVVGYDLTRLLIGSEGTLGIITEAILKLSVKPEVTHTIRAVYSSIDAATKVITQIMQQDIIPCALELLDSNCLELLKNDPELNIPNNSQALLLIEVNGSRNEVASLAEANNTIFTLAKINECLHIEQASDPIQRNNLWKTRKALSPKLRYIAPRKINEDVAVPISNLPKLIHYINNLSDQYGIKIVNFGHAGNGNIHVNLLIDPEDLAQNMAATTCLDLIFSKVIELNGTLSGEHGVGLTKAPFVSMELSTEQITLMKNIKKVFDNNSILNPALIDNL